MSNNNSNNNMILLINNTTGAVGFTVEHTGRLHVRRGETVVVDPRDVERLQQIAETLEGLRIKSVEGSAALEQTLALAVRDEKRNKEALHELQTSRKLIGDEIEKRKAHSNSLAAEVDEAHAAVEEAKAVVVETIRQAKADSIAKREGQLKADLEELKKLKEQDDHEDS